VVHVRPVYKRIGLFVERIENNDFVYDAGVLPPGGIERRKFVEMTPSLRVGGVWFVPVAETVCSTATSPTIGQQQSDVTY